MDKTQTSEEHLSFQLLFEVASTQDKRLTALELEHLRSCSACSDQFADAVYEYIHEGEANNKARHARPGL